jgi:predicted transcriptional regulator
MPSLTITITEERHRALQQAAERERKSIAAIIEECLDAADINGAETAQDLVVQARSNAGLSDVEALAVAVEETQAHRSRQ